LLIAYSLLVGLRGDGKDAIDQKEIRNPQSAIRNPQWKKLSRQEAPGKLCQGEPVLTVLRLRTDH